MVTVDKRDTAFMQFSKTKSWEFILLLHPVLCLAPNTPSNLSVNDNVLG